MRRIQRHVASTQDLAKDMCEADSFLVLAMALHQSRDHETEARAALTHGQQIVQDKLPRLDSGDLGIVWYDTCLTYILLREATTLMEGNPKPTEQTK